MFFQDWGGIWRTVVVGVFAYLALLMLLRLSGKRTLSKLNVFDLVVTVALGSTLATILLNQDVALAEGATAFAVLIAMQWLVAKLSVKSQEVGRLVKASPRLLYYRGEFDDEALTDERVTHGEIRQAVRAQGKGSLEKVLAVVMETDGSLSIVSEEGRALLQDVDRGPLGKDTRH